MLPHLSTEPQGNREMLACSGTHPSLRRKPPPAALAEVKGSHHRHVRTAQCGDNGPPAEEPTGPNRNARAVRAPSVRSAL
jgi:hypothetical protein